MRLMWFYSLVQCAVSVAVIGASARLCGRCGAASRVRGRGGVVTACLRRCLGWAGAVGAAVGMPVDVLLNLRSPQCLYVCITLVCCPLLVRQFTMGLQLLLTIDAHLQWRLGHRYAYRVTRQQALCLLLLVWVSSVVTAFSQFIVSNRADTWEDEDSVGLGLEGWPNHTSPRPPPRIPHVQDRSVIGKYLPYAGVLSKFMVEDLHNFTYKEIHGGHWAVCAPDAVLSSVFLVGVFAVAVFLIPLLVLLAVYLDLACARSRRDTAGPLEPQKKETERSRSLVLTLSLLVLLCLPLHTIHALRLLTPASPSPVWATSLANLLFQAYALVPPLLFASSPENAASGGTCLVSSPPAPDSITSSKLTAPGPPVVFCPPLPTPKDKTAVHLVAV